MNNQLIRGIKILELLAEKGQLSIDQIRQVTKIPMSTIFKILTTFEALGYVFKERNSNQTDFWFLTLKILKISELILSRLDLKDQVRDILEKLSKDVNEIVQLGIYNKGKVMYIDIIKKPDSIISLAGIGKELDINISAAGMVLAAALKEDELNELLDITYFHKNTVNTLIDPKEIKKELKLVAANGYAFDDQQYAIGVRCLASPIYNFEDKVVGAINITGHISTMSDDRIDFFREKVINAALEASRRMGNKSI